MEPTANTAEVAELNRLTVKFFQTPPSKQNFTKAEKDLLKKYGIIGKTSKSEYARAYTALS